MTRLFFLLFCVFDYAFTGAQPPAAYRFSRDSMPLSVINVPLQIQLQPIYLLTEKHVDTVFTSPNYPLDWVQYDCTTRYKYHFRRSPLRMTMSGTTLHLSFTGYYRVAGSTRACVGSTVLSPWTPACRCGFDEPERRVHVGFAARFRLLNNHILQTQIVRGEPQPLDKCSVCFWGQDITGRITEGLKEELDLSRKAMEDSFGRLNLRPFMQAAWNQLQAVYTIPNIGYFSLHPKQLRMENIHAKDDLLHIQIGIAATPVISFEKPAAAPGAVPDLSTTPGGKGFNIFLDAALQYDSLSRVLDSYLAGKRFDVADGLFKKHIIVQHTAVTGNAQGQLLIQVDFTGSFDGTVFFTGTPSYSSDRKTIEVRDLQYDLKTKNLLLKTAKWLFNKKIISQLNQYTSFDLSQYYQSAASSLNTWLNREWTKGIRGTGAVTDLKITSVNALPGHLVVRSNCIGNLNILVSELALPL